MRIIHATDYEDMSRKAANIIAAQVVMDPACVLGLATGSTPIGTYQNLIKAYEAGDLDFSKVSTYNLDEYRGLSHDDPQSYHYFMKENLFDHINIDQANTHVPDGSDPDAEAPAPSTTALSRRPVTRICSSSVSATTATSASMSPTPASLRARTASILPRARSRRTAACSTTSRMCPVRPIPWASRRS